MSVQRNLEAEEDDIQRQLAQLNGRLAKVQQLKQLEHQHSQTGTSGARVLVKPSPSPKKRSRDIFQHEQQQQHPPTRPSFHPDPVPAPVSSNQTQYHTSQSIKTNISKSNFASHESALPRQEPQSNLMTGMGNASKKRIEAEKLEELRQGRSRGFSESRRDARAHEAKAKADSDRLLMQAGSSSRSAHHKSRGTGMSGSDGGSGSGSGSGRGSTLSTSTSISKSAKEELQQQQRQARAIEDPFTRGNQSAVTRPSSLSHPHSHPHSQAATTKSSSKGKGKSESDGGDDDDELDVIGGPPDGATRRRKDWTVIETIPVGPRKFKTNPKDPDFVWTEPNSGIRLKGKPRQTSHAQLQDHLDSRYHLTPALVYSLARSRPNSSVVDLDVDRDFIVIGVLAWKDETRYMKMPKSSDDASGGKRKRGVGGEKWGEVRGTERKDDVPEEERDGELFENNRVAGGAGAGKDVKPRRYVRFTLVDLATERSGASGDGTLNLMLFEAEETDTVVESDGYEVKKYRGGSGGAYEKYWKETTGSVVAILNPQISRAQLPSKTLTLKPESADSMIVIGEARDLRFCEAIRKDTGRSCGSWCDARVSTICEFHTNLQLKRTSSRRAETYSANSSLLASGSFDAKSFNRAFKPGASSKPDPTTKTGLLPRSNKPQVQSDGTLIHVVSSTNAPGHKNNRPLTGSVLTMTGLKPALTALPGAGGGRGTRFIQGVSDGISVKQYERDLVQRKKDRELRKEAEKELLKKDLGKSLGGQYLEMAAKRRREEGREEEKRDTEKEKEKRRKMIARRNGEQGEDGTEESGQESESGEDVKPRKKAFTTTALRRIGYDPTRTADTSNNMDEDHDSRAKRLDAISSLEAPSRPSPSLAPPPGPRIRSVLVPPPKKKKHKTISEAVEDEDKEMPDLCPQKRKAEVTAEMEESDDDDDLVVLPKE
ncbi:hypothetical protein T439DRAFT_382905 [Meredithblackwellia eburnea MCA 4105]